MGDFATLRAVCGAFVRGFNPCYTGPDIRQESTAYD